MKTPTVICLAALAILFGGSAGAEGLRHVHQSIYGMDCAPCAYGVEKGLRALPGVQHVAVSLNEGYAEASLAEDASTTLAQIRDTIRNNGFTPKQAALRIEGEYSPSPSATLRVGGHTYRLHFNGPEPESPSGRQVVVTGTAPADADADIVVERFEPAAAAD